VLRRDAQQAPRGRTAEVALFEQLHLLDDLAGIAEELGAVIGEAHTSRRADEERAADARLEVLHRRRHRRLRDVQHVGGRGDRPSAATSMK
jgi:hypothetical protein